ncbi:ABC transporter permease [Chitinophaga parva]|uniref:ABC transporter permease n=1 Tax=Chitinophaga parva TaxID=2169414 RepID=A0A2T7BEF1_9BACT|nr:ABC transporter permease [Chitinophaga parva]
MANYIKASLRFQAKHKTFSLINITGLALGTLCCLYILLYVMDQFSYDSHHRNAADIYRVTCVYDIKAKATRQRIATTAAPVAPLLKKDYGEVLQYTRVIPFAGIDQHLLTYNGKTIYEKAAFYVDSTFFRVFTYHFIAGNPATALDEPHSVVLLKSTADKLFGAEDPIGKTFYMENAYDNKIPYTVKGIVDESLGKSHLHANIFITMNSGSVGGYMYTTDTWTSNTYASTYIKLRPDADAAAFERKLPAFINRYAGEQLRKAGIDETLVLQPITTVHTTPGYMGILLSQPVDALLLKVLAIIAIMIQLIACINFMNLSTARASHRAREVGVRKVLGAGRADLLRQFLGESLAFTLVSVLIAVPLLVLTLPYLNQLTQSDVGLSLLRSWRAAGLLGAVILFTALLSGSYPALYLSAFQAVRIMKGNFTNSVSASGIRRGLVVFQFTLSIVLISGIVVIYAQLNYIKHKDLGFEKEQRLVFQLYSPDAIARMPVFVNSLSQLSAVTAVSNASSFLSNGSYYYNSFFLHGQKESAQKGTSYIITDEHFVTANGIRLLNGRDFMRTDSSKVLVNETFAKMMGLNAQTAVGTILYDNQNRQAEIVGVMKDFHYGPLRDAMDGFVLWKRSMHDDPWPMLTVSVRTTDYKALLAKIAAIWKRDIPGAPFAYTFLDDQVAKQYESERTTTRIIDSFTMMAIVISCMGLFGLAAFSAEQRRKEISIRKVMGASVGSITQLLSMDFLKLVLVAFLIAVPIAWWLMHKWLQGFAYSVPLQWWMFALAGALSLFIAVLTVSFQSIRAALINPVRSLRSE